MTAPDPRGSTAEPTTEPKHWWRLLAIWVVLSVVGDVVWIKVVGPHVPPGRMSDTANGAQFDFNVLFVMALPVIFGVWVYLAYAIFAWRGTRADREPPTPHGEGNLGIQTAWISITTVVVLFLAGFGTYELVQPGGAGGGQGPTPLWTPSSHNVLTVQVIGQQWKWTYRYPSFGGFETTDLVVPIDTTVAFHVTSLDVIHSFWAYQLGVKADANPGVDDVAYTTPNQLGTFIVRCNELCGLWHGAMYNSGTVVTKTTFEAWATKTETTLAANTANLPPFAYTYTPDANGADGGYYPDNIDPYSNVEIYGATPSPSAK